MHNLGHCQGGAKGRRDAVRRRIIRRRRRYIESQLEKKGDKGRVVDQGSEL